MFSTSKALGEISSRDDTIIYAISYDWFQHTTSCSSYGFWYTITGPNTELLTGLFKHGGVVVVNTCQPRSDFLTTVLLLSLMPTYRSGYGYC